MKLPALTPIVEKLPATVPFVGPEALERLRGRPFKARIGANESVFGPSPSVIKAMQEAAIGSWRYGDPENHDLKVAVAASLGITPANVTIGEGIDGLFGHAVRMFVAPGIAVASSHGAYPTFNFHVAGFGGRLVTTPYRNDREDPAALLDLARKERAKVIFFANPDNPMGSWSGAGAVSELIRNIPDDTLLILDEAYGEFAPPDTLPPIDVANPQVLRFRTFSKAHGMAGVRVGYAFGEANLIRNFDKVRNHFGVGRIAQAGALAALADKAYLTTVVGQVAVSRDRIAAIAAANGLRALPSATNFVAVDCGGDGAFAKRILDGLIARDIFVRMPGVAPLNRCIRISAGAPSDLAAFAEAFPGALADARANT